MTIVTFDFYSARYEHMRHKHAASGILDFRAKNAPEAAKDFLRFYNSRQEAFPEAFGTLLAVQIFGRTIGEIHESGASMNRNTMCLFEWKIDSGWTYGQRVDRAQHWLDHSQRGGVI